MIKEIYAARDDNGGVWEFVNKPRLCGDNVYRGDAGCKSVQQNTFNLTLKPLECVKVIIDTLNQSYRVEKVLIREDGYYAATKNTGDETWILQSKGDVWHFYRGGKMNDTYNMRIGTKPIPKECLP